MILSLQVFHTLYTVFIYSCIFYTIYCGIKRIKNQYLYLGITAVLLDGFIFAANGFVCPLQTLVQQLSGDNAVSSMFGPAWAEGRLTQIGAVLFVFALALNLTIRKKDREQQFDSQAVSG